MLSVLTFLFLSATSATVVSTAAGEEAAAAPPLNLLDWEEGFDDLVSVGGGDDDRLEEIPLPLYFRTAAGEMVAPGQELDTDEVGTGGIGPIFLTIQVKNRAPCQHPPIEGK